MKICIRFLEVHGSLDGLCIRKFGAASLQRNSRPAVWSERSRSSVIPVSLCRFLSKQPWNLSRLTSAEPRQASSSSPLFCAYYSVWWPPCSSRRQPRVSVSVRVELLSSSASHTEAAGQGSCCAQLCFKGTEPRALKHAHSETDAYTRVTSAHGPGIPWQRKLAPSPPAGPGAAPRRSPLLLGLFICTFLFLFHNWAVFRQTRDRLSDSVNSHISVWPSIFGWSISPWRHITTGRQMQYHSVRIRLSGL